MEIKFEIKECMYDFIYCYYYLFDKWEDYKDIIKNIKNIHPNIKEFEINYSNGKYYYKVIVIDKKQFIRGEKESKKVVIKRIDEKINKEVNIPIEEYEKYETLENEIK